MPCRMISVSLPRTAPGTVTRLAPSFFSVPFTVTKPPPSRCALVFCSSRPSTPRSSARGSSAWPSCGFGLEPLSLEAEAEAFGLLSSSPPPPHPATPPASAAAAVSTTIPLRAFVVNRMLMPLLPLSLVVRLSIGQMHVEEVVGLREQFLCVIRIQVPHVTVAIQLRQHIILRSTDRKIECASGLDHGCGGRRGIRVLGARDDGISDRNVAPYLDLVLQQTQCLAGQHIGIVLRRKLSSAQT